MLLHRSRSRSLVAGAALLLLLTVPGPTTADVLLDTVYLPTSSVVTLPSTSLLPTTYVVPSSYTTSTYLPTSYTSSYLPTSYTSTYLPTSTILSTDSVLVPTTTTYYRPSIFRSRRFVERTSYSYASSSAILPTTYLMPTSYPYLAPTTYVRSSLVPTTYFLDDSVVTTSMASIPCETSPSVAPTRATVKSQGGNGNGNGKTVVSEPSNTGGSDERKPTAIMNNGGSSEESVSSNVVPPVRVPQTETPPKPTPVDPNRPLQDPPINDGTSAPKPPTPAGPGTSPNISIPSPGSLGNPGAAPNELSSVSRKPTTYDTRNILRGRVISADTKRTEEGITVILTNVTKTFADRQAMTDADGEFKVSLPDGDWSVKVKMPSGRIATVGQDYVTASSGKVTDASGRLVELVITR